MPVSLRSVDISIKCDGQELTSYCEHRESESVISAYVASEAGKTFKIEGKNRLHVGCTTVIHGERVSLDIVHPFKFIELELFDPDVEPGHPSADLSALGQIEVKFLRITDSQIDHRESYTFPVASSCLSDGRVSERSKKAGRHGTRVDQSSAIEAPISEMLISKKLDPADDPYITFKVRYQPEELLRANGTIPRHPAGGNATNSTPDFVRDERYRSETLATDYDIPQSTQKISSGRIPSRAAPVSLNSTRAPFRRSTTSSRREVIDLTID
ncbi:hypothetical protein BV25DRAFT_1987336 [Artomyces pyxidatus]|uniref:Uncharacterized protein n=1 Tax=Artomyces pyxidatus TaxID=48021 RepID=A0ACB8TGS9_9AGAM|nr:hypothetical protein BV25DRAFT_1987336 [Artomyces pyxidatus]